MEKPFENILGKGENADEQHFLLFSKMLESVFSETNFKFFVSSIFSSRDAFSLDWSNFFFVCGK